tara:strand:+ start:343 stop:567 length:225 start_codon:yes stop_codon:yes gene_type:complete
MNKEKAWVWFKGDEKGGSWVSGFLASSSKEQKGILIERSDFVSCRLPEWRVKLEEPKNLNESPEIPKNSIWKYI